MTRREALVILRDAARDSRYWASATAYALAILRIDVERIAARLQGRKDPHAPDASR